MRTVILASHGHLASGMKNTVEMILGEQEALKAFDAYTTPECNVHDTLEAMLRQAVRRTATARPSRSRMRTSPPAASATRSSIWTVICSWSARTIC